MKRTLSVLMALLLGCVLMGTTGCVENTPPTEDPLVTTEPTGEVEQTEPTEGNDEPTESTETEPVVTEPTDPVPTEPVVTDPTDPVPTEPQETMPTEPDPTEPVGTDPTEPEETRPTEPAPTEPVPTEPTPTEPTPTEPAVPAVNFRDVDETVYATTTVNVRSGPGSDYEKLGTLYYGNSIQRTGVGDNGWSRVVYNGQVAYMHSDYLSTKNPAVNTGNPGGETGTGGTAGGDIGENTGTEGTTGEDNTGGNEGGEDTGTTETQPVYVQDADPTTGISWDGVSPILYYYTDGTTGYEPRHMARYEIAPNLWDTYVVSSMTEQEKEDAENGIFYCSQCNKVGGDGTDGTCIRHLMVDWTCPNCGTFVPVGECHTCGE